MFKFFFSFFFDQSVLWTDVKSARRSNDLPFELKCTFADAASKLRVIFNSSIFMVHVGLLIPILKYKISRPPKFQPSPYRNSFVFSSLLSRTQTQSMSRVLL